MDHQALHNPRRPPVASHLLCFNSINHPRKQFEGCHQEPLSPKQAWTSRTRFHSLLQEPSPHAQRINMRAHLPTLPPCPQDSCKAGRNHGPTPAKSFMTILLSHGTPSTSYTKACSGQMISLLHSSTSDYAPPPTQLSFQNSSSFLAHSSDLMTLHLDNGCPALL